MERHGNNIVFSTAEQRDFAVGAVVDVWSALDTAYAFMCAAGAIESSVVREVISNEGTPGSVSDPTLLARRMRAAQLAGFASGIFDLCPAEHLAMIANQSEGL